MGKHTIVGAGPVGSAVAAELLARGEEVRVVTRSGGGPDGTDRVRADAHDGARLAELAAGSDAIYNCVNPPYDKWAQEWPGIAAALLTAAEASGAVLATTGNLYGYGRVDGPMTEATPLAATGTKGRVRNRMWADALAAHEAGRVRAFEVRGSDYLGGNSYLSTVVTPAWRRGRTAWVPADLDVQHTFTDVRDVAALLVTGVGDERAWGHAWHVPSDEPVTLRELTTLAAGQLGVPNRVRSLPYAAVWLAGVANPFVRELRETQHQFRRPYVLDSSLARRTFDLTPHPLAESVRFDLANDQAAPGTAAARR
ncbi:Nucleoside-diphosphate-sugar epimerase [Jatrophihabitans endophyticus]|uniref:Nucleoside-diphosphate-sugar epimerase n=1 Tax=Jatrophihabitans endophyticus TaxID=1206085 RepID=A0A1M5PMW9_9ACTN|nr:NAD-dependent epimerase/dehydratase family protein [Jatrophihabitans endophyticus]SHH03080.1 Nucleoside-diphosphate-sugar epimerase [Jatrophihabitans endophyticus]